MNGRDSALWVKGEYHDGFDAVDATARGTLDRSAQPHLFDRLEWFRRTWTHVPPGSTPLIARARTEGADAWLFLALTARDRAEALASWYTLAFRPVFTGKPTDSTRLRLLTALARRLRGRLGRITLAPVPEAEALLLLRAFRRGGWLPIQRRTTVNWRLDLGERDFDAWWAERPGQLRSTVARKGGKSQVDIVIHDRFDDAAWAAYESIYAESWKPEEGSPDFLRAMAEAEGAAGALRLGIASVDGTAVAAQLWTVDHGIAIIHKLAHRESAAELSPGTLLSAAMFQRVIETDRVAQVDFGTGDDRYKADWMDERRPLYELRLFNPRHPAQWLSWLRAKTALLVRRDPLD